jgi:hypothetical protein
MVGHKPRPRERRTERRRTGIAGCCARPTSRSQNSRANLGRKLAYVLLHVPDLSLVGDRLRNHRKRETVPELPQSRPVYRCDKPNLMMGLPRCMTFAGPRIDSAIARELLRAGEAAFKAERMHR